MIETKWITAIPHGAKSSYTNNISNESGVA
jgi:hypothetical protein